MKSQKRPKVRARPNYIDNKTEEPPTLKIKFSKEDIYSLICENYGLTHSERIKTSLSIDSDGNLVAKLENKDSK